VRPPLGNDLGSFVLRKPRQALIAMSLPHGYPSEKDGYHPYDDAQGDDPTAHTLPPSPRALDSLTRRDGQQATEAVAR
jgi:hypothetical protein